MTREAANQINGHFAAIARDVAPVTVCRLVRVLYAPFSRDPAVSIFSASVLSEAELQRANRFASETDKARFQQRRAFRRYCGALALGTSRPWSRIVFGETENGRPYLCDAPDTWFSFSSCSSGFLGAWSSTHGIGVDIEDPTIRLDTVELADQYFSSAEAGAVKQAGDAERLRTFLRYWSLKEAALKSIGEGLPFGLDAFQFELTPNPRVVHAPRGYGGAVAFDAYLIEGTSQYIALVTRTPG